MPHYDSPASPADTPVQTGDYVSIHWDDLTVDGTSVKCPPHTVPAKVTSVSTERFTAEMLFFQPPSSLVPRDFDYLFDDPDWERLEIGEMSERQRLKYLFDELKRFAVLVNQQLAPTNLDRIVSGKLETRGGLVELQLCCAKQGRNGICARPVRFTAGGVERTAATLGKVQEYLDELAAAEPSGEGSRKVKRSGSGSGKSPSSKRAKGVSPPPEDDEDEDEEEGDDDEEEGDDEAEEEGEGEEEGEEEDPLSWLEPLGPRPLKAMCKAMGLSYYGFAEDASAIAELLRERRASPSHAALREACRAAGLPVGGKAAELAARLKESIGLGGKGEEEEEEETAAARRASKPGRLRHAPDRLKATADPRPLPRADQRRQPRGVECGAAAEEAAGEEALEADSRPISQRKRPRSAALGADKLAREPRASPRVAAGHGEDSAVAAPPLSAPRSGHASSAHRLVSRPRGRAPAGKVWCMEAGEYIDDTEAAAEKGAAAEEAVAEEAAAEEAAAEEAEAEEAEAVAEAAAGESSVQAAVEAAVEEAVEEAAEVEMTETEAEAESVAEAAMAEEPAASEVETASAASRPPTPRTEGGTNAPRTSTAFADITSETIVAQRRLVAQARLTLEADLRMLERSPPVYRPPSKDVFADSFDYAGEQATSFRQHVEEAKRFLEDLEAAREQANKSRSSANAAQAVLDQLQQAKAHQDQRQAKEEEARTTFATLAAANAKGDYSGAHSAAVAYAALAEEVKNLKDNEYAAKERILARAV